jgi:uncharacterized protein YjiS (DUF1127 family)
MSFVSFPLSAWKALGDWNRRQRAYEELMALDDHCLADLGIQRSQINAYLASGRHGEDPSVSAASRRPAVFGKRKPA